MDVVLEYWDGDSYEEVTSETKLFNDAALWEPGYTEVAYLKVSNAGSLALKYQMGVTVLNESVGKTKTNADINLSEHLQFKVVESDNDLAEYASREDALNANVTASKLQNYNSSFKPLAPKSENGDNYNDYDYIALIVYMVASRKRLQTIPLMMSKMRMAILCWRLTISQQDNNSLYPVLQMKLI